MKKFVAEIHRSLAAMPRKNVPSFRVIRREWSRRLNDLPGVAVVALAKKLVPLGPWERGFAYEVVACHPNALEALNRKDVTVLGRGIQSWGDVDCFAAYVAGPAWRLGIISDNVIEDWARSSDRWWRRASLVSTVPLNNRSRGGKGDVARTLMVCRMLAADHDDMVVKALSWALRELGKRNPQPVRSFLKRYDQRLAPRVKREVSNKLKTGLKNPRYAGPGRAARRSREAP